MTRASVVVPTFNRWERLERVLAALGRQTADDFEVVVVSDGSTDGTDDRLRRGEGPIATTFLAQPNRGPGAARNAGVDVARGDLIVFIDDDVIVEPECVEVHIDAHAVGGESKVVIGPLLTPDDERLLPWIQWEQDRLYEQYGSMYRGEWSATARQFYTGNASLSRALFQRSGGFDESLRRAEDVELAYRLRDMGATFEFRADARAFHHAERSYESWRDVARSYGANDVRFWRDHGQEWLLPTISAEYRRRHILTRAFTRLGLAVPAVGDLVASIAPRWSTLMAQMGSDRPGRRLLSAVYNLTYYRALVDELGGLETLLDGGESGHLPLREG